MPGRFFLLSTPQAIARLYSASGAVPDPGPRYNIAPAQSVLIVRFPEARKGSDAAHPRELAMARWGMIPRWAREPDAAGACIDTPLESIRGKPALRDTFAHRRCVIPADGFFDWPRPASREPVCFRPRSTGAPFALAALWDRWEPTQEGGIHAASDADGSSRGGPIDSCTILTVTANAIVAPVHGRMPVILRPDDIEAWLDPSVTDPPSLRAVCRPHPAELMRSYPVSALLNNPKNDSPVLIIPAETTSDSVGV